MRNVVVEPAASPDPLAGLPQLTIVKELGIGSFGSVALYQRDEGRGEPSLCAVKFMPRSGPGVDVNLIQREIQSHRVLRHPHVIRFKQLGLTGTHIYMCMDYADQGDLLGFLRRKGPLPEADARWLFQQIIFGLDYCHLKGVVNRDLKPENLLLKLTPEASKRHRRLQMQEREQQQKLWEQMQAMHLHQHQQQQQLQRLRTGGDEGAQRLAPAGAAAAGASANSSQSPTANGPRVHSGAGGFGAGASVAATAVGSGLASQESSPPPPVWPPLGVFDHRTSNTFNLHIKIADFGLSKRAVHSLPKTRVGTINYMAPEVLLAGPAQRYDGQKADIWSAGVVLYAMLFSRVPFESLQEQQEKQAQQGQQQPQPRGARDRAATIQRILEGDWAVPPGMSVSPQCLHLLTQMLVPDPVRRIPMAAIMEHPWFRAGLPPAALTMNMALVRQQAAQGQAGPGDQTEAEIDAILDELRRQAEVEAAMAAAASVSRSSDDFAEERRAFEVKSLLEEDPSPPAAAAFTRGGVAHPHVGPAAGAVFPIPAAAAAAVGGYGSPRHSPAGPAAAAAVGGAVAAGAIRSAPAMLGGPPPPPGPNAFLVRLARLGPGDVAGTTASGANGMPAAAGAAAGCGGIGAGGGGQGCGPALLTAGSSTSRRAEALDSIDFIPGRS